jgi:hypothetical protein
VVRFAVTVAVVEFVLTTAAGLYLAASLEVEPYATRGDFQDLGLEVESFSTSRQERFERLHSYDTQAKLSDGTVVWVKVRMHSLPIDYELHLRREKDLGEKRERGVTTVLDEPLPGELGHTVRQRGTSGVRAEVVRFRGDRMLIVGFRRQGNFGPASAEEAARCERLARSLRDILAVRLGWLR